MQTIEISPENQGRRIDKFLAQEFFSYSRGEIAKKIKDGLIIVNGNICKPSQLLKSGDQIRIMSEFKKEVLMPNKKIKLDIIFKNADLIVINKPAGIQVHPSATEKNNTLVNGLVAKFPEIISVHDNSPGAEIRPGIVHRLDKETSGIMLVARNLDSFEELKKLFQTGQIRKKYLALVYGRLQERKGVIKKSIARSTTYRKQIIATSKTKTKIRPAITEFRIKKEFPLITLVEAFPKTGRMHQIRIHFSSINHPVIGDKLYIPRHLKNLIPKTKRQMLHAEKIDFFLFGEKFSFSAPIPQDFAEFIGNID